MNNFNQTYDPGFLTSLGKRIDSIGLRRTRLGRSLIASLNVAGRQLAKLLYLRQKTPLSVDGHLVFLSGRRGPSLGFVEQMIHGRYEVEVHAVLETLIRPGMTVFDVGAHVGHYTLLAARLVGPAGHVYAFEADPDNFSVLQKNVSLNGYKNVTCVPKAVSDRSGTVTLHVNPQGNDRHSIIEDPHAPIRALSVDVPAITLDEFAASLGWPQIDVIKMDIEGAEPLAIAGMAQQLKRANSLALLLEFAPEILRTSGKDPIGVLRDLISLGFTVKGVEEEVPATDLSSRALLTSIQKIESRGAINLLCTIGAVAQ